MRMKTQVLIIGGGITGVGLARDLALRGISCALVERRDINAGASGANHGLLHSGARYVRNDPLAAVECREESGLLKRLAPQCVEATGGLFVAVEGDDEDYAADFPNLCQACGIAVKALDIREAREMEPVLCDKLIAAYLVEDASIDPFRLSLENIYQALELGCTLLLHTGVEGFAAARGRIRTVRLINNKSGQVSEVEADLVVNAAGAWAKDVAALAGVEIDLMYSKGSLLITDTRINQRVINRLRPASDADILVPGGTVSILGTTSVRLDSLEDVRPTVGEIDYIIGTAAAMVPCVETVRYIRAYAGVRPLVGSKALDDDRAMSRGFALLDHARDGLENFVSIVGGKLTTYRRMAEKTADLVCGSLGLDRPCLTGTQPLPARPECEWTTPGLAPRRWLGKRQYDDLLLCECEMVPQSAIAAVIDSMRDRQIRPDLYGIGRRSRVGKGTCQGAFCGTRILSYMYDRGDLVADQGLQDLRDFLSSRWKGMRPILWDAALAQEELQEALHCGLFGLELNS
jgi:glycerol-3-phosphate dehydrogenase